MTQLATLEFSWFTIFVILICGYAILDGFDLGVGMLHMFSKKDVERRLMLNSIGPIWDGNEVWLITAGGALFAGFPAIYATLCSAFYAPIMLFLSGIIFRAVSIEFRSKQPMSWWRWMWDILFSLASLIISFGLGLVMGNLVRGIPLDKNQEFIGDISDLVHPYAIITGLLVVTLFLMHGSIFLCMKTDGEFHEKIRKWVPTTTGLFVVFYAITTFMTLIWQPHMIEAMKKTPLFFLISLVNILAIANIPREIYKGNDGRAFLSSCVNIACLIALFGIGMFPDVIRAINDPENLSLTIYNGASSSKTLIILHTIAIIGIPMVLSYTFMIYYIFHGKVRLDSTSY